MSDFSLKALVQGRDMFHSAENEGNSHAVTVLLLHQTCCSLITWLHRYRGGRCSVCWGSFQHTTRVLVQQILQEGEE